MDQFQRWMQEELKEREHQGLLRQTADYSRWIDFCSNDYLGIGRDRVLEASIEMWLKEWNCASYSSGGSRLISGHAAHHEAVERFIATQHQTEAALLFDSGYMANHGLITALGKRGTTFLLDAHCHASIVRSAHQSQADHVYKFAHNRLDALEQKLRTSKGRIIVYVERVYSMDGDCADIASLLEMCSLYDAQLIVDEAHAFGWQGPQRIGMAHAPHKALLARVFTYGKGAGCHGAAIAGSRMLRDYLVNFSAPFIYTTATTPHLVAAIRSAYDYLLVHAERTAELLDNIAYWKQHMGASTAGDGPIQIIRHPQAAALAAMAQSEGLGVKAILPPTVKPEHTCLRVCLHSYQKQEDMQRLIALIQQNP